MATQLTVQDSGGMTVEQATRNEMIRVLRTSLYPGASAPAVAGVLDYCRAAGLNPMLKPVHIVPMYVKSKDANGRDTSGMREVIMPGIAHYRTQASRTGRYIGKAAPEWGPVVEYELSGVKVSVPEWCRVTIKVVVDGHIAEFTAEEWWLENYATKSRDSKAPNSMWEKRSRGQLAKVSEAQALRIAFPELLGGLSTAEEMEGKTMGGDTETLSGPAAAAPRVTNANAALDNFAGVRTEAAVIDAEMNAATEEQKRDAFGLAPVTDDEGDKPKGEAKAEPASKVKGKAAIAAILPLDDGQKPTIPGGALNDWETEGNWEAAWRWISETLPKAAPGWRQELVDDNAEMLRAIAKTSTPYRKAVDELLTKTGTEIA